MHQFRAAFIMLSAVGFHEKLLQGRHDKAKELIVKVLKKI